MKNHAVKPLAWMALFILMVTLACSVGGGNAPSQEQVPPSEPAAVEPTQVSTSTDVPLPPQGSSNSTATPDTSGTAVSGTIPANCKASETAGYLTCTDDRGIITIDVPDTWLDFNGSSWIYNGEDIGFLISASSDLTKFYNDKNTPGLFYGASDTFAESRGFVQVLDEYIGWYRKACDFEGRTDYTDGIYKGKIDRYSNCDGRFGGNAYVLAAVPVDDPESVILIITVQLPEGQDATLDHILKSFSLGDF